MFTGIIQSTGTVAKVEKIKKSVHIAIKIDPAISRGISDGGSVAIDGVCLTAIGVARESERRRSLSATTPNTLTFELMDSTLKLTTLGARRVGDIVNIEPAMRARDIVGGHFVSGHVDGTAVIKNVKSKIKNERVLELNISEKLARYVVSQGSITVNGVSLTVVDVKKDSFSVALTKYTATHTNLGALKITDKVNIEVDMFAKYIFKFLNHYGSYKKIPHSRGKV
ncbi:MAG: riboflavin synthase [bacterium]|nr:riboflavin synthase [bacterium]